MKRPLCLAAVAWILGEFLAADMKWMGILPLILLVVLKIEKRKMCAILLLLAGILAGFLRYEEQQRCFDVCDAKKDGEKLKVSGCVERLEETEYGGNLWIRTVDKLLIQAQCEELPEVFVGQRISVLGTKKEFLQARNPGNFDEKEYRNSLGIGMKLSVIEILELSGEPEKEKVFLQRLRKTLCENIRKLCGDTEAGILNAIIYGERQYLEDEKKTLFQESGIAHILVVSGLHMSALGLGIYRLCRRRCSFAVSGCVGSLCLICFGIMTGFGISVQRAMAMMLLRIVGDVRGRTYDFLTSLCFSSLFVLGQNPHALFGSSFVLSFGTVFLIGVLYPYLCKRINTGMTKKEKKKYKKIHSGFAGIFTGVCQMPVLLFFFYQFSPYSILLNLIVIPLLSVLFFCGMCASFLAFFHLGLAEIVVSPAVMLVHFYIFLCEGVKKLPVGYIRGYPQMEKIIAFLFVLTVLFFLCGKLRTMKRRSALLIAGTFCLFLIVCQKNTCRNLTISVIDVGQGDCTLVQTAQGKNFLVDGGSTSEKKVGRYRILPYLKYQGVDRLEAVFLSHGDADHINGVLELLEGDSVDIGVIFTGDTTQFPGAYEELFELARRRKIPVRTLKKGDVLSVDTLKFFVCHPGDEISADINESSLVFLMSQGEFSMLFTGDIGEETEAGLIEEMEKIDVLKTAHHGSKYASSQAFLEKVRPALATISCGADNRYGHPHEEVLDRLEEIHTAFLVTARMGCIGIEVNGAGGYEVKTFLKAAG